eukprot:GHVU01010647.1.p1 GENE.GHVU01010647.1~~GHVU01010647.1.p1  ORF type:complete len:497 (+),score=102.50 GHVU01010647.1:185-1675(+)
MPKKRKAEVGRKLLPGPGEAVEEQADDGDGEAFFVGEAEAGSDDGAAASDEENGENGHFSRRDDKRLKVAKKYLKQLEAGGEDVAERLRRDADAAARKLQHRIADELQVHTPIFLRGHKRSVTCVAAGCSDDEVFTGSKDCCIIKWNPNDGSKTVLPGGRRMFDCGGHFEEVHALCVEPHRRVLLSGGGDALLRLWDARLGRQQSVAEDCGGGVAGSSSSSGGRRCLEAVKGFQQAITGVDCDPLTHKNRAYVVSKDRTMRVFCFSARRFVDVYHGHTAGVTSLDCLLSERPLTGGEDGTCRIFKMATGSHLLFSGGTRGAGASTAGAPVESLSYVNSALYASGAMDGALRLWNLTKKKPEFTVAAAHAGEAGVTAVRALGYSDVVFTGGGDGFIRVWQVCASAPLRSSKGVRDSTTPVGGGGAVGGGGVHSTLKEIAAVPAPGFVNSLSISTSGKFLYAALGKEPRLGRWCVDRTASDGLLVVPLSHSAVGSVFR